MNRRRLAAENFVRFFFLFFPLPPTTRPSPSPIANSACFAARRRYETNRLRDAISDLGQNMTVYPMVLEEINYLRDGWPISSKYRPLGLASVLLRIKLPVELYFTPKFLFRWRSNVLGIFFCIVLWSKVYAINIIETIVYVLILPNNGFVDDNKGGGSIRFRIFLLFGRKVVEPWTRTCFVSYNNSVRKHLSCIVWDFLRFYSIF